MARTIDQREELGLLALEREIHATQEEVIDLWMDVEIEERPRFRAPLEAKLQTLTSRVRLLESRWLR